MLDWLAIGWPMFVDPAYKHARDQTYASDGQDVELPDEPTPKVLGCYMFSWMLKEGILLPQVTKSGCGLVPRGFSFLDAQHSHTPTTVVLLSANPPGTPTTPHNTPQLSAGSPSPSHYTQAYPQAPGSTPAVNTVPPPAAFDAPVVAGSPMPLNPNTACLKRDR